MQTFFKLVIGLDFLPDTVNICMEGLHPVLRVVTDDHDLENLFCRIYAFYRKLLTEISVGMFFLMIPQTLTLLTVCYLAGRKKFRKMSGTDWSNVFGLGLLTLVVYLNNGRGAFWLLKNLGVGQGNFTAEAN